MAYVECYVVPVPKARLAEYTALATMCSEIWKEHGALSYQEAIADDVAVGERTSFPRSVQLTDDEIVVVAWVTYPDRATRDACNTKVMADPRLANLDPATCPLDGKRMFFGGFTPIVTA